MTQLIKQMADLSSVSQTMRANRFRLFRETLQPGPDAAILDVGGTSAMWLGTGLEKNVTLLNLTEPKLKDLQMGFKAVKGNALDMHMFADQQFDIVFSNSVIEHLGSYKNQKRFASEVHRVGRHYWVQTPNRRFPVEPHFMFPFFQFFPDKMQKKIAVTWKHSHFKRHGIPREKILAELANIRLLTEAEFKLLFIRANLIREEMFGFTKSFVAYA